MTLATIGNPKALIRALQTPAAPLNSCEREKTKLMQRLDLKDKPFIYRLNYLMGD
jgi:hypothetical protein